MRTRPSRDARRHTGWRDRRHVTGSNKHGLGDDGELDSDDPVLANVTGTSVEALVLYADDGTTTYLIMYQDTGVTGLPLTPDGSDVQVLVDAAGWFAL